MGRKKVDITAEQILEMRAQGMTNAMICQKLGVSKNVLICRLNPDVAERQKLANMARYVPKPRKPPRHRPRGVSLVDKPEPLHLCRPLEEYMMDWQKVKVEGEPPPPDRRDNTGKLLGDPMPERSALARIRMGENA